MSFKQPVLISTTPFLPGHAITEYKGIVFERVVAGVGLVTEFFAGFSDTFGGRSGRMESQMDNLYQTLLESMIERASEVGANGIVGFSIDIDEISGKGTSMLIIQGLGTAVLSKPSSPNIAPNASKTSKDTLWQCAKCGKVFSRETKYCTSCGEIRHYDWVCSSCASINGVNANFCARCGKARETFEEKVPIVHELPNGIIVEDVYIDIEQFKSAGEVYKYLIERYGSNKNDNFKRLLSRMSDTSMIERSYGNRRQEAIDLVHRFFDHGMHVYEIDGSLDKVNCPECEAEQKPDRTFCFKCGALFISES